MASQRGKAIRDLDRYAEHLRRGYNLVKELETVYADLPDIAAGLALLAENAVTAQLVVDELVNVINQG